MLGLAANAVVMRRIRRHTADPDRLRQRQHIERALAGLDWAPPGVPPSAIVLVRHLRPAPRPRDGRHSFGERVSIALRDQVARAKRPWIDADAAAAGAILFVDEAEMIACYLRDWLRGAIADRWWWRGVLDGADPETWLRQRVLARGDLLVPAVSLLAPESEVVPFVARLSQSDAHLAAAAVARAFALPMPAIASGGAAPPNPEDDRGHADDASQGERVTGPATRRAIARVLAAVPELRARALSQDQRRLLTLLFVSARAATWGRTTEFLTAVTALERRRYVVDSAAGTPAPPVGVPPSAPAAGAATAFTAELCGPTAESLPDELAPAVAPAPTRADSHRDAGSTDRPPDRRQRGSPAAHSPKRIPQRVPRLAATPHVGDESVALASAATVADARLPEPTDATPLQRRTDALFDVAAAPALSIETEFGGVFYLLNAWIAMGLYSDFTAPAGPNLATSPWDLLALVGRRWFAASFVADPVWTLLAELAQRDPQDEPVAADQGQGRWLEEHCAVLMARLQLAIGVDDGMVPSTVCAHRALIEVTLTAVHVHLGLAELPLCVRLAGLDRDPGWIPAAGRSVSFHFA